MSETKNCGECKNTKSTKFRSLKGEKWREAENNDLVKITWEEGIILCNVCYMSFVENPLKKGHKRVKTMNENVTHEEKVSMNFDLTKAIKVMANIFYEREHLRKEGPIYEFDEMRRLLQEIEPSLKEFFDQLYLAARPLERNEQTMDCMKNLMVFICYLLISLNNTKINSFKLILYSI